MPILVDSKLFLAINILFMPINHIKKVPSKNIIFCAFCRLYKTK